VKKIIISLFLSIVLSLNLLASDLKITVFDVGQGLSIVVRTPDNKTMIYDTGSSSLKKNNYRIGLIAVDPYLKSEGIRKIDLLMLSHPHTDHYSGLQALVNKYPITDFAYNGKNATHSAYKDLIKALNKQNPKMIKVKSGYSFKLGDKVKGYVYNPSFPMPRSFDINNGSIAMKLTYGKCSIFFTGDCNKEAENAMISKFKGKMKSDVLIIGHHGSHNATTSNFLKEINPSLAVISCGKNNSYGHPSKDVLKRLGNAKIKVLRTDINGAITIISDGSKIGYSINKKTNNEKSKYQKKKQK